MLLKILGSVLVVFCILVLVAALKSPHMNVSREILVQAKPEVLFSYINHSKKANDWMPWQDSDPGVKMVYSGPDEGVGSKSSWESAGQMGTGEALVVESVLNQKVRTALTYEKPFKMSQMAEVSLSPVEGGTLVKWSVTGEMPFFFRFIGIFMNCDKMVGGEFEKGLSKLKKLVEAQAERGTT